MINAAQGNQVYANAVGSGEWTYSEFPSGNIYDPSKALPGQKLGDCTDLVRAAVKSVLGRAWAAVNEKSSTSMFLKGDHPGFTEVDPDAVHAGDVIVQGTHAGMFAGFDSKGNPMGWANNGSPRNSNGQGYSDHPTTLTSFAPGRYGAYKGDKAPHYYRPINN